MHLAKPYSPAVSEESRSHQPSSHEFNLYWKGGFGELHRHKYYLFNNTILTFVLLFRTCNFYLDKQFIPIDRCVYYIYKYKSSY